MGAVTHNIIIERGIYFEEQFTLKDDSGTAINLTGYEFKAEIHKKGNSKVERAFSTGLVNASEGKMKIYISGAQTGDLTPGHLEYDLVAKDSADKIRRYVKGEVTVHDTISSTEF